jgi:riboflavin synthase
MFTGIIESIGTVKAINYDRSNINFSISSSLSHELKIDQSISHNGVCLTVVSKEEGAYTVTAIKETLDKTNLGNLN